MHNNHPEWLSVVREKVETLRFGVVQVVVHDSKIIQIERTERIRIEGPTSRPATPSQNLTDQTHWRITKRSESPHRKYRKDLLVR